MRFLDQLKICIAGDASVNALSTGGIKYELLPINFDKTKEWIVFNKSLSESIDTVDCKGAIQYYDLEIQCVSPSIEKVITLSDTLNEYLDTYDDGKIRNISLTSENTDYDNERSVHYITSTYSVLYEK